MKMLRLQGENERQQAIYYEFDLDRAPLGEGGMGRVFQGYRVVVSSNMRIPVAIKVVYDGMPESVIERARREASIQMDNDNLIRMYGFVETEVKDESRGLSKVCYYIIMELLVGVTLNDWLKGQFINKQGVQIDYASQLYAMYLQNKNEVVVKIIKNILSGIMALHDKGFIHRDIDPTNVMITYDGKIKLIDFGICKQITTPNKSDQSLTEFGSFIGKVNYAAPEQIKGDVYLLNETTDIYAVGILFYQLYTGQLPFIGTNKDLKYAHLSRKINVCNIIHPGIRKIILKATNKKQRLRYVSAAEFRVALDHLDLSNKMVFGDVNFYRCIYCIIAIFFILLGLCWGDFKEKFLFSVTTSLNDSSKNQIQDIINDTLLIDDSLNNIFFNILESNLDYPKEGGTKLVQVYTNSPLWEVTGSVDWCNVEKNVNSCKIIVDSNNSDKKRNNKLIFIAGEIKDTLNIEQSTEKISITSSSKTLKKKKIKKKHNEWLLLSNLDDKINELKELRNLHRGSEKDKKVELVVLDFEKRLIPLMKEMGISGEEIVVLLVQPIAKNDDVKSKSHYEHIIHRLEEIRDSIQNSAHENLPII